MSVLSIPRPEYPRPQFVRGDWMNLNGTWEFETDPGCSGKERRLFEAPALKDRIVVPFCPESRLSGVACTDFMASVWYRRTFELPPSWQGGRVMLHFGAVDYDAEVWVNGRPAGTHRGGYVSFALDITALVNPGSNTLHVWARDDVRSGLQPRGKQSGLYFSHGCDYTRTTGIWQTVWLERVPQTAVDSLRMTPDAAGGTVLLEAALSGDLRDCRLTARATADGVAAAHGTAAINGSRVSLTLTLPEARLWSPEDPFLYDLTLELRRGDQILDRVESYFGVRSLDWSGKAVALNGKPVFQRLVLDQGFYPEGVYTAPTDNDLKADIERSMAMGFNGARLHQKIFEPRFLYWADRLGYMVWGEHGSWGLDIASPMGLERFLPEWLEALRRDYNHPAIVGWCPFNETWDKNQDYNVVNIVYKVTRQLDPTRPVIDTSGGFHIETDLFDIHDYNQDPAVYAEIFDPGREDRGLYVTFPDHQQYGGQPYFVSEYGGIWWNPGQAGDKAWGYGGVDKRPRTEEDFLRRYEGLTRALMDNPHICAFCYTQLTDVEQEVNGLYTYDRKAKFDPERIRRINARPAAIEKAEE